MHEQSKQGRTRTAAITAVLALLASMLSVVVAAPAKADGDPACTDVIVIGARGSGEQASAVGPEVQNFSSQLANQLQLNGSGATVSNTVVPYQAPAVLPDAATIALIALGPEIFFGTYVLRTLVPAANSINDGIASMKQLVDATRTTCPRSQIVLSGYSAGAMVIHQLYQQDRTTATKIFASVLIADGDRVSSQGPQTANLGNAPKGAYGIRTAASLGGYLPGIALNFPLLDGRIVDVCDKGDLVCDYNHSNPLTGISIHTSNYKASSLGVDKAAIKVAQWYKKSFGAFNVTDVSNNGVIQTLTSVTPCPPPPASQYVEIVTGATPVNPSPIPQYQAINANGSWSTHVWMLLPPRVSYNARTATATITTPAFTTTVQVRCVVSHGPSSPTVMSYTSKTIKAKNGWKYQIKINSRTLTSLSYTIISVDKCPAPSQTAWIFSDISPDSGSHPLGAVQNPPPLITNGNWSSVTLTKDLTYWSTPSVVYLSAWVSCGDTDVSHGDTVRYGAYGHLAGWQVP